MRALQIGFQTMIANNQLPSYITKEEALDMFFEVGNDLAHIQLKNRRK